MRLVVSNATGGGGCASIWRAGAPLKRPDERRELERRGLLDE
jgi:hypothetical protein